MERLIEILSEHKGTGTPWGISYWTNNCARKAKLDREMKEAVQAGEVLDSGSYQAKVGTAFHKTEELWLRNKLTDTAWPLRDKWDRDDPIQEALRVFSVYQTLFSREEFTLVEAEELWPKTEAQTQVVAAEVGLEPYTFQPDQIVHIDEKQAAKFLETRFVDLMPGYWMRDTKTHEKKDSGAQFKYNMRLQFQVYMRAYNILFPERRLNGTIVNDVICHAKLAEKEDTGQWKSFKTFIVTPASDDQWASMKKFLMKQAIYIKTEEPNFLACCDWSGCIYAKNGMCDRMY